MEKEQVGRCEDRERGVTDASGGEHALGDLDGGFSSILENLGPNPFSSLDLSFPLGSLGKLALVP